MGLPEQLSVAPCGAGLVALVRGHGGWLSSSVLIGLADGLNDGQTLFVDLRNCTYIDSSFVGALVRIHQQLVAREAALMVLGVTASVGKVFTTMHLDGMLLLSDAEPPPLDAEPVVQSLVGAVGDQLAVARHVRDCHAALAAVPGPHRAACQAVVDQLDREFQSEW